MSAPYADRPRPDTGFSNARLGLLLFLAADAMFFAALFSAYVLLRMAASDWPAGPEVLPWQADLGFTIALFLIAATPRLAGGAFHLACAVAAGALALSRHAAGPEWVPADGNFFGLYAVMTWAAAFHVLGGVFAEARLAPGGVCLGNWRLYWGFQCALWLAILGVFYLV